MILRVAVFAWVALLVVLPLAALVAEGASAPAVAWAALTSPSARDAIALSVWTAALVAVVNAVAGTTLAWMLVRWDFPGRQVLAWVVELPLAIPTLVAGILIVALYGPHTRLGGALDALGAPIVFARPGIVLVLLLVTLPFVVRAVEPVVAELDPAEEEAAATLGATDRQALRWVLLPPLLPAVGAGAVQVFARSVAEFGAVATVSGNLAHHTLTAPVWVLGAVEGGDRVGASAVSLVLLGVALAVQVVRR